jgi:hypothetical protein
MVGNDDTGSSLTNSEQSLQSNPVHADIETVADNIVEPTVPKSTVASNGMSISLNFYLSILSDFFQNDKI